MSEEKQTDLTNPEELKLGQEVQVYFYGCYHTVKIKSISYKDVGFLLFEGSNSEHHILMQKSEWAWIKL